jgi:hypothetical protein
LVYIVSRNLRTKRTAGGHVRERNKNHYLPIYRDLPDAIQFVVVVTRCVTPHKSHHHNHHHHQHSATVYQLAAYLPGSPVAVHPVSNPVAVHPVSSPVAVHPVSSPVVVHPVSSPVVVHPVSNPAVVHPVSNPVVVHPVSNLAVVHPTQLHLCLMAWCSMVQQQVPSSSVAVGHLPSSLVVVHLWRAQTKSMLLLPPSSRPTVRYLRIPVEALRIHSLAEALRIHSLVEALRIHSPEEALRIPAAAHSSSSHTLATQALLASTPVQ